MTSKNSAYKEKKTAVSSGNNISLWQIIREDLRHRNWMIVLSSLVAFLTSPVAFVFCEAGAGSSHIVESEAEFYKILAQDLADYLLGTHLVLQMMVIYVGAFIVAVFGFHYLFSKKMVDLYHSMPVSRTKLFFAHYISGFLVWFVPFLIGHLSVYIMALFTLGAPGYHGKVSAVVFGEILLFVICFLIVYNAYLVPIMISGNIKNSILNILIYGCSVVLGYAAIISFMELYFDTYTSSFGYIIWVPIIMAFSPAVSPVFPALCFIDYMESGSVSANPMSLLIATLIGILIMMVVNLFLSVIMYQKRPSELAERGVDNKWFRIPLRFVVSILAGLLLSLFFAGMAGKTEFGWTLFGGIFGCIFSFSIMNILYHASFKALFSHKRQLLCSLIIVCAIIPVFHFDLLGYDTYLPDKDKIIGISFYDGTLDGPGYALVKDENGYYTTTYSYTSVPKDLVFTDAEANYKLLKQLTCMEEGNENSSLYQNRFTHNFTMRVDTTTGSYYRRYTFEHTDEIAEILEPYLNSKEFVEYYYPIGCGTMDAPAQISVTSLDDFNVKITDASAINKIYQAYSQDFTKHYDWSDEFSTFYVFKMEFLYPSNKVFNDYCHITLEIPSWYSQTIACLKELYPTLTWSQDDLSFTSLNVAINSTYAGDEFSELQNYLGVGPSVNPLITTPLYDEKQCGHTWYREISDPAMVETLRPYLYLNERRDYSSKNYVYIGEISVVQPNLTSETAPATYYCYMKRGEIPEGFAESLWLHTK